MQAENKTIERIGHKFGVLGVFVGLAFLMIALVQSQSPRSEGRSDFQLTQGRSEPDESPYKISIRRKGKDGLFVYRKRARAVERLLPGASARSGDLIQIGYVAPGATHGVIFSVDGRGVVTLHHPARLGDSTALEPFGRQLLPYAFELDGAPRYERIFFVTGTGPINVSAVLAAGGRMTGASQRRPPLPAGLRVCDELVLKKSNRR